MPRIDQRQTVKGALLEVHHADADHQHLVGQVVNLRWSNAPKVQEYVRAVTRDVHFSQEVDYTITQGLIHPERLNHWQQVNPLESLAGARPHDDLLVMLREPVVVEESQGDGDSTSLYISSEPVQISGRFYGLVQFLHALEEGSDQFRVVHFNPTSRQFDGQEEIVRMPQVIADQDEIFPSTSRDIENSPLNPTGWYIYGAQDRSGRFVVQAIAPRALWRLQPERVIFSKRAALKYLKKESWADLTAQKGRVASVLLSPQERGIQEAIDEWQEGDRALVVHVYGGIGGKKTEPAAKSPIYFGHFAYGMAQVVREPITDELRFEIEYQQVYTHNISGLISGNLHWSRYMGDRQWGFLGIRPVVDILIKLDAYTKNYDFDGQQRSALDVMSRQLETMMARYRIGDGSGGTYVGPANNCAQDSNQAMYAAIRQVERLIKANADFLGDWEIRHPQQAERFERLMKLGKSLKRELLPLGTARADWQDSTEVLGISLEDDPLKTVLRGLGSWRTMLPRVASDSLVKLFLHQGASVWVLRTNQVGGFDPDIEPIAPMTF